MQGGAQTFSITSTDFPLRRWDLTQPKQQILPTSGSQIHSKMYDGRMRKMRADSALRISEISKEETELLVLRQQ